MAPDAENSSSSYNVTLTRWRLGQYNQMTSENSDSRSEVKYYVFILRKFNAFYYLDDG